MQIGDESLTLTLTLDLMNPKSVGYDTVLRTLCQVSSHSDQGYTPTPRLPPTYPHIYTYKYIHHDKLITVSALLYYVVGANNNV